MNSTTTLLLRPVAWAYGQVALRRRVRLSQRAKRLSVPVVSVGNITCGGTGKTPTVEMLARDLAERGRRPAILSRGYRASRPRQAIGHEDTAVVNDEFAVLSANVPDVPHLQGKNRVETGHRAVAAGSDVIILDDGFQHVRLGRDLDFVLVDALRPFSNGCVLPAGLLREPLSCLQHADLFGITRSELVSEAQLSTLKTYLQRRFPGIDRVVLRTLPVGWTDGQGASWPTEALVGRTVLAFCGLGHPRAFRLGLEQLGLRVARFLCFRDHHRYTLEDLQRIESIAGRMRVDDVVMTQKDAVKLPAHAPFSDWKFLRIAQDVVEGGEAYERALDRLLAAVPAAR